MFDASHWGSQRPPARVRSHARRHERAAVVADTQGDDLASARRQARHHQCRLNRFRARVAEKCSVQHPGGNVCNLARRLDVHLVSIEGRNVPELLHLLGDRAYYVGITMPD